MSTINVTNNPQENKKILEFGMSEMHIYGLLRIAEVIDNGKTICLVEIKDPEKKTRWKGDWNADSDLWNERIKKAVSYDEKNAENFETFWMSFRDFKRFFKRVAICKINLSYHNSYTKLRHLNDKYNLVKFVIKNPGEYNFCVI